jgi:glycosyltransferase involved in cell wall biosynthesis
VSAPLVVIIANVLTPYRLHVHRRVAREMPEVQLASVFTHDQADQPWDLPDLPEINPVRFGDGDPVVGQGGVRSAPREWAKAGRIIAWLRERRAAAVLVGGYNDAGRLRILRWAHRRGVPVFMYADSNVAGDHAAGARMLVKRALLSRVVRWSTGIMPCGTLGEEYFLRYGARRERVFYWPYEPDYARITGLPSDAIAGVLAECGLDPARRRAVVCSRLQPHKRVELAVEAFTRIAERRPDWDLVVVGDGPERARIEGMAPEGLRRRIVFTGFIGDQDRISAIYRGSHVLVHPSGWEPWGVVINEAIAAGMAIIASPIVGAAADLVQDGRNGFFFPPGDAAALAERLERATDSATLAVLRAGAGPALAAWRARADPVERLRAALRWAGVLGPESPHPAAWRGVEGGATADREPTG